MSAPRRRGHLDWMTTEHLGADEPVTFASLGFSDTEARALRADIDRERKWDRARWLAAGVRRAVEAAEARAARAARRRELFARLPRMLAERAEDVQRRQNGAEPPGRPRPAQRAPRPPERR